MRYKLQFVILLALAVAKATGQNNNITTQPPTVSSSTEQSTVSSSTQQSTDSSSTEQSTVSSSTEQSTDSSSTQQSTDSSSTQQSTDSSSTQQSTDSSSTEQSTDSSSTQQSTDSSSTEQSTDSSSTQQSTDSSSTQQSTDSSSTQQSTDSSSTEQSTDSSSTEQSTDSSSTQQSTDSSSTQQSTDSSSTEQSTDSSSTEQSTDSTTTENPPYEDFPITVVEGEKPPCILAKMNVTLNVKYNMTNGTTENVELTIPENTKVSGKCGTNESSMILSWPVQSFFEAQNIRSLYNVYVDRENKEEENKVSFYFKKDAERFSVNKIDIEIVLDSHNFPNAKDQKLTISTEENLNLFAASASSKYVCSVETVVKTTEVELSFTDVRVVAFNNDRDIASKSEENCSTETVETANVGAIVGGIIGALAIVGIIGFIIWRRRRNSHAHSEVA